MRHGLVVLLALGGCQPERLELVGDWSVAAILTSNTCGIGGLTVDASRYEIDQDKDEFTATDDAGNEITGTIEEDAISFEGTTVRADDEDGCEITTDLSGEGAGCDLWVEGTVSATMSFDPTTCVPQDDCTYEADLVLTELFGPFAFPVVVEDPGCPEIPGCTDRGEFEDPRKSLYVLPYPSDEEYLLTQSYCFPYSSHADQLAYDFGMPLGSQVVAARAGVVREVKEDSPDEGSHDPNYVLIEHSDGTVAFYAHLQQDEVRVSVDDEVGAGQVIALSGSSGYDTEPHLHFGVYQAYPPVEGQDVPVNFMNTKGMHDFRGGLVLNEVYRAEPEGGPG